MMYIKLKKLWSKPVVFLCCSILLIIAIGCKKDIKTGHKTKNIIIPEKTYETIPFTTVKFDSLNYDLGVILDTGRYKIKFNFQNTGNEPLFLKNVIPACHCTVINYKKNKISPNETSYILAEYEPTEVDEDNMYLQTSKISVTGNFENDIELNIYAKVKHYKK